MKFLCVPCDSPMKLQTVGPPESGSLSVVYACPECGYEMAMLTNPFETQLVTSLGVRIGPDKGVGASPRARRPGRAPVGRRRVRAAAVRQQMPVPCDDACHGRRGYGGAQSQCQSGGLPPPKRGSQTFPRSSAPWPGPASRARPRQGIPGSGREDSRRRTRLLRNVKPSRIPIPKPDA